MKEKVNDALKSHFRPEFLNRIDEMIVFHELSRDEVLQMVDLHDQASRRSARGPGSRHRAHAGGQGAARRVGLRPAARCPSAASRDPAPDRRCAVGEDPVQGVLAPARSSSSTSRTIPRTRASSGSRSPPSRASCPPASVELATTATENPDAAGRRGTPAARTRLTSTNRHDRQVVHRCSARAGERCTTFVVFGRVRPPPHDHDRSASDHLRIGRSRPGVPRRTEVARS